MTSWRDAAMEAALLATLGVAMWIGHRIAPDQARGTAELAFGFLLLAAFLAGRLFSRVGLPRLTGWLATGVISGPYVLGLVDHSMAGGLRLIGGVAVALLAMTAGGELDLREVKPLARTLLLITRNAVLFGALAIAGVILLIRPLLPFLQSITGLALVTSAFVIAVALVAQSPAVVIALLAETRARGPVSQLMLAGVVLADIAVIVLYAIAAALAQATSGAVNGVWSVLGGIIWELLGSAVLGLLIGGVLELMNRWAQRAMAHIGLFVCVAVAEIGAHLHLDPLILMLVAGIWLRNRPGIDTHAFFADLEVVRLPVFLVFFSLAGAKLDLGALAQVAVPVVILVVARAAVFRVGVVRACEHTQADPAAIKHAWVGFVPQAGLALALALMIQKSFPTFGAGAAAVVFGVVAVNELLAPIWLKRTIERAGEANQAPESVPVEH